jgi:ATP-binding cassette subfamily B protein
VTAPLRTLLRYAARYRFAYAAGIACLALATALSLAIPKTVQRAIEALERDATASVAPYVGLILLLATANAAARMASRFAIIGSSQRVEHDVRDDLYASLLRLPPAFYGRQTTGDLMARASSDTAAVRSLLGFGVISLFSTVFAFAGAVAAMLALDPWLTLLAVGPYPLLAMLGRRANALVHAQTQAAQEALGTLSARVQEHLVGISVVRAYTMEPHAAAVFDAANRHYQGRSLALARSMSAFAPIAGIIGGTGTLVVLWLGGHAVIDGRLTLGALVAFSGYLGYLAWPTLALGFMLTMVRRGLTSIGRVQEVIAAAPPPGPGPAAPGPAIGAAPAIRFTGLHFEYEGRAPVLRDVSFEVPSGATVAVVGPTGSGKTTLCALLARLWEPPPGTVWLGGHDVTTLSPAALRGRLGYVPQEAFLFSRSIADNVALGRPEVSASVAQAAAEVAAVQDEIAAFPQGWETVVGERGLTVSGGQRQRIALARALAGAPPVLVLDDVFASVDAAKEEEIVQRLRGATLDRTVLLVTHRLRAARAADRIVVLAEGRVVEEGTHEALVGAGGTYTRLWREQQLEEEIARA